MTKDEQQTVNPGDTGAMTDEGAREFRAADLAKLLQTEILDAADAAAFLGLARNSIEYAAYRKRIPYVQYGAKKLFTRQDLQDYARNRGKGRDSKLEDVAPLTVKTAAKTDRTE